MSRTYYWNRTCDWYSQYLTVLCWEVRSYGVRKFFVNDFLQLTHSFLTFFLTLYCCIKFLTFPKIVFLYFHIKIPLEIGCKFNIYETYVRSMYILFPRGCEEASKPVLLDNNMFKVNHKCTKNKISNPFKFNNEKQCHWYSFWAFIVNFFNYFYYFYKSGFVYCDYSATIFSL